MLDSVIIGAICFFIILMVEKFVPKMERWKRALMTAIIVAIAVVVWLTTKPVL